MACYHRDDGQAFHDIKNIVTLLCCHFIRPIVSKNMFYSKFQPQTAAAIQAEKSTATVEKAELYIYLVDNIYVLLFNPLK